MLTIRYSTTAILYHPELGEGFDRLGEPSEESPVVFSGNREFDLHTLSRKELQNLIEAVTGQKPPQIKMLNDTSFSVDRYEVYNHDALTTYPYIAETYDPDYNILRSKAVFTVDPEVMPYIMTFLTISPSLILDDDPDAAEQTLRREGL